MLSIQQVNFAHYVRGDGLSRVKLLVAVCVTAVGIFAAFAAFAPSRAEPAMAAPEPDYKALRDERSRDMATLEVVPCDSPVWEQSLAVRMGQTQSDLALPLREKLVRSVAAQVRARAEADPARFVSFVQAQPGRWIDPQKDEKTWRTVVRGVTEVTGSPPKRDDVAGAMLALHTFDLTEGKARFTHMTSDPKAMLVMTGKTAYPLEVSMRPAGMAETEWWNGWGTMSATKLHEAPRSVEEVIASEKSVKYAQVWMVVESESKRRFMWHTCWYYDPAQQAWMLERAAILGGNAPHGMRM